MPRNTCRPGLYLVGEVGRGKSMLMDLFFDTAEVPRKQRIHFHRFMQNVARPHPCLEARRNPDGADPIPPLADQIAAEAALLCFDEFQVNDIADAMILGRLFQALFDRGVVVVTTSNTAPDDLFKGQPGRDAFLPFIALIKQRLELLVMDGGRDYRRERMRGLRTWQVPADAMSPPGAGRGLSRLTGGAPVRAGDSDGDGPRTGRSAGRRRVWRASISTACAIPRWGPATTWRSRRSSIRLFWTAFRGCRPRTTIRRDASSCWSTRCTTIGSS